ncbi:MAG: Uncharacterized protein XE02_0127 [Mesotoga infera]|jgi:hypothetical protein|uniref:Uncharacterized protein n=2 Tax=Mesotoga infera TaxID=1236046 RepID=A0A101I9N1_9BACT|nr:MAG: Uncharacterized protein XD86_0056 [Mesotoga infera]KUK91268.1 MAG: Uncharacterized protein XE02_0127 [Mesotoga infera]
MWSRFGGKVVLYGGSSMEFVSNVFFVIAMGALFLSLIFFEIGTKKVRKPKSEVKPEDYKPYDKKGWYSLVAAGGFLGLSLLFALIL